MDKIGFVEFMAEMITKYGYKRHEIAQRAGMPRDYVYKILNGSKQTKERDYLISLSLAIGMTSQELERALVLYHFPKLEKFERDKIIRKAFDCKVEVDTLDEMLKDAGQSELVRSKSKISKYLMVGTIRAKCAEIDEELFTCIAEMRLRSENGKMYYLLVNHGRFIEFQGVPVGFVPEDRCTVLNRSLFNWLISEKSECPPPHQIIEDYEDIEEAEKSEFYPYFLRLKSRVDEELKEVEREDDDTAFRNDEVICGGKLSSKGLERICEAYEYETGAYIQVIEHQGSFVFSATEESRFRYWELGDDTFVDVKGFRKKIHFLEDQLTLSEASKSRYASTYKRAYEQIQAFIHSMESNGH